MTTWNEMTEVQKMAHSLRHGNQYHLNPSRAGMLTQAAAYNSNRQNDGLTFGANTGPAGPAYAPSWGIDVERDNPNGTTGVHTSSGFGFSGNPEHFVTGQAARDLMANAQGNPMKGGGGSGGGSPAAPVNTIPTGQRQQNGFMTAYNQARSATPMAATGVTPTGSGQRATPYLDAYVRATERSQQEGPVSKTLKKYLEE